MRITFARWILLLFLLSGGLPGEFLVESSVKHAAAEEDSSSERQDESSKAAASRKRNARAQKTKRPGALLLAATAWPSYTPFADDRRLFFSPTSWNPNRHQLHQIFRI
jgi:hypothetical protein